MTLKLVLHGERWQRLKGQLEATFHRHPKTVGLGIGVVAAATICVLAFSISLVRSLPDKDAVSRIGAMDQATTIFDDGDKVAFTIFREQRIDVPLSQISSNLIGAVIATEDQRFFAHHGFDILRIAAAAGTDLRHRNAAQGASTITQQLARQSFLKPEKTLRRKLQELLLARRIEQRYSKPQILEMYLNKVYFGDGRYGAEAAARGYFGKSASQLSVAEAATLAGLVKAPSNYAPTVDLKRATARRNVVLQAMLDAGAIDRAAWQSARSARMVLANTLPSENPHGQYFKEQVRRELLDRFGWQRTYQGGLRVYSTIDMQLQEKAEDSVRSSLAALTARRSKSKAARADDEQPLQAALVALDPRTGQVRAMVGGRDFNESPFNRAVQAKRQPGSAFKPFVYATALEMGYSPATVLDQLDDPIATIQGAWTPEDEHSNATAMTLRTALRTSSNRAAVKLLRQVGLTKTVQYANNMGISDLPNVPSLALGSGEVTLQAMTAAYAAFANHGMVTKPTLIRRVEDRDGNLLYQDDSVPKRAISETTAFLMSTMLADVIDAGTAARARTMGLTLPAAGKTGTTNDFFDAWFVGYTPHLIAGVWVGFDQPQTIIPRGFAGDVAVPLWATFMKKATAGDAPEWFTPPAGITTATVCRISGKLASEGCKDVEVMDGDHTSRRSMLYTEYFVKGTEPTAICDLHATHGFFGKVAAFFGGSENPPPPPAVDPRPLSHTAAVSVPPVHADAERPAAVASSTPATPEKDKRGFFGRLFHRGNNDRDRRESNDRDHRELQSQPQPGR